MDFLPRIFLSGIVCALASGSFLARAADNSSMTDKAPQKKESADAKAPDPITMLKDSEAAIRLQAVRALAKMDRASDGEILLQAFSAEDSPEIRVELVRALNRGSLRGSPSFAFAARAMFQDLSDQVRAAAAQAMTTYPGERSLELIDKFMTQERGSQARATLCAALSSASALGGSSEATTLLARTLSQDESLEVRQAALSALEQRQDRRAIAMLKRLSPSVKDPALHRRVQKLIEVLSIAPKVEEKKSKTPQRVSDKAVKGVDFCGDGNGWCECSRSTIRPKPRCIPKDDCIYSYENSYRRFGYRCTWDGASLD